MAEVQNEMRPKKKRREKEKRRVRQHGHQGYILDTRYSRGRCVKGWVATCPSCRTINSENDYKTINLCQKSEEVKVSLFKL